MRHSLLKKLFKAISTDSENDIRNSCEAIIRDFRIQGQLEIADELSNALNFSDSRDLYSKGKVRGLATFPNTSRPAGQNIFTVTSPNLLDRQMIISKTVEKQFERVEQEFMGRGKLGQFGLTPRTKLLLYGPSGCGKSLGSQRLASNLGLNLVRVDMGMFALDSLEISLSKLRSAFDFCVSNPSVLVIEAVDALLPDKNGKSVALLKKIIKLFTQAYESYPAKGLLVFTLTSAKKISSLSSKLFDEVIFLDKPDDKQRRQLVHVNLDRIRQEDEIDFESISNLLKGFSCEDIIKIVKSAVKDAVLNNHGILKEVFLQRALNEFVRAEMA